MVRISAIIVESWDNDGNPNLFGDTEAATSIVPVTPETVNEELRTVLEDVREMYHDPVFVDHFSVFIEVTSETGLVMRTLVWRDGVEHNRGVEVIEHEIHSKD